MSDGRTPAVASWHAGLDTLTNAWPTTPETVSTDVVHLAAGGRPSLVGQATVLPEEHTP